MRARPLAPFLTFAAAAGLAGCLGNSTVRDARIEIEQPLPRAPSAETPLSYAVERDDSRAADEATAALTDKLVDQVRYELLRRRIGAPPDRSVTRIAKLRVLNSRDVGEWTRAAFGVLAGSDKLYADVQVLAGDPPTQIGLAHLEFSQFLSISTVNENAMVLRIAEAAAKFLAEEE